MSTIEQEQKMASQQNKKNYKNNSLLLIRFKGKNKQPNKKCDKHNN